MNNTMIIAQINTTPRDFEGNIAKIIEGIKNARDKNADWLVYPELTIPGYLCQDLMYNPSFINANIDGLRQVMEASKGCKTHVIVGYIDYNRKGTGKPFLNKAAVICDGRMVGQYSKHLLPFYDVFDEGRYFEPGNELLVVSVKGSRWGICICEDVWNDKCGDDYSYVDNPIDKYRKLGIKNIISINSSPYIQGKPEHRKAMLSDVSRDGRLRIVYVNQIGGQDELVFDGNSFVVNHDQKIIHVQPNLEDSYEFINLDNNNEVDNKPTSLRKILTLGLKDYIKKSGFKEVVIGLSGGVDSAVVAALACNAIGASNVHCVRMPSVYSSEGSKIDALELINNFGCHDYLIPISHQPILDNINSVFSQPNWKDKYNKIADENIQARLRGLTLMHTSNAFGWLLLTTGNKTESACGYCTLYGDMAGGFNPIKDLYKGEVYDLAKSFAEIPKSIIEKPPSAELAPNQTDEASLMPYVILDQIVKAYIEYYISDLSTFCDWLANRKLEFDVVPAWKYLKNTDEVKLNRDYDRIIRLCDIMEFKRRQSAPGIKISKVAFGMGRRLPIVKR